MTIWSEPIRRLHPAPIPPLDAARLLVFLGSAAWARWIRRAGFSVYPKALRSDAVVHLVLFSRKNSWFINILGRGVGLFRGYVGLARRARG
jgi:hypothetical protein